MTGGSATSSRTTGKTAQGLRLNLSRVPEAQNRLGIGLDFGTSNSAAAIFDGRAVHIVHLEASNAVMPSACYIDTAFSVETGEEAIRTYIEANRGRRVELSAEIIGEARTSTGQMDESTRTPSTANTATVYGAEVIDASMPGRLFFGIKRLLGNASSQRIRVFNKPFRLVALITPVLNSMFKRIEEALSNDIGVTHNLNHGCIGHPVDFEGDASGHNAIALNRLGEAYRHTGIVEQRFCPEPIAAAISYLYKFPVEESFRALTVDFGGGTLDLCVVRKQGPDVEVEAVYGIALGGDKIDQAVFRELVFPLLGKGELWRRTVEGRDIETEFPFWMYEERLLNWQVSYTLNQNKFTTPVLDQLSVGGDRRTKFLRLYDLITNNSVFEVFQAIKRAKERLSSEPEVVLDIPAIDLNVRLDRNAFESIISELLADFERSVDAVMKSADVDAADIDVVLRTGGSALIPAFARILDARFPERVVEHDPFTGVATGLAIADYYGIGDPHERP